MGGDLSFDAGRGERLLPGQEVVDPLRQLASELDYRADVLLDGDALLHTGLNRQDDYALVGFDDPLDRDVRRLEELPPDGEDTAGTIVTVVDLLVGPTLDRVDHDV